MATILLFAIIMSRPTVKELFSLSGDEVAAFLGGIYEHSPWVARDLCKNDTSAIETVTALANAMKAIVDGSSHDLKMKLLSGHPNLCEKVGKMKELTAESQEEQSRSGLQNLNDEELAIFTKYNTTYREKFGFPFILAVRNATKYTVLSSLQGRVRNSPEVEFVGALGQVHKIAWMRLLSGLDTSDSKGFLTCHVLDTANGCPGTVHRSVEHLLAICLSYSNSHSFFIIS
jgi:2-oxo-4-hydroxy-4-carboxy-5-ureidoimidazoline decarboxylase